MAKCQRYLFYKHETKTMNVLSVIFSIFFTLLLTGCTTVLIGGAGAGGYVVGTDERPVGVISEDIAITTSVKAALIKDEQIEEDLELGLTVSCSNFERHIKELKSKYKICSMNEFVENLKKKTKEFMIAITFDDGYKDNLYQALQF